MAKTGIMQAIAERQDALARVRNEISTLTTARSEMISLKHEALSAQADPGGEQFYNRVRANARKLEDRLRRNGITGVDLSGFPEHWDV